MTWVVHSFSHLLLILTSSFDIQIFVVVHSFVLRAPRFLKHHILSTRPSESDLYIHRDAVCPSEGNTCLINLSFHMQNSTWDSKPLDISTSVCWVLSESRVLTLF